MIKKKNVVKKIEFLKDEQLFRALIENSHDVVTMLSMDGTIIYDSPSIECVLGYSPKERLGEKVFEFADPKESRKMKEGFTKFIRQPGSNMEYQGHFIHKDRTMRWMEGVYTNLLREPMIQAVVVNYRDITDRKHAEKALRESEEKYRILAESSSEMIYLLDRKGLILYINSVSAKMLNSTPDLIIGQHLSDIFPPKLVVRHIKSVDHIFKTGEPIFSELIEKFPNKLCWIEAKLSPVKDEQGNITGVLGISRDITERKQAEEALRESETKYRALVENSLIGIGISQDNRIVYANKALMAMYGYTDFEEYASKSLLDYLTPQSREFIQEWRQKKVYNKNQLNEIEHDIVRKDGEIRTLRLSIVYIEIGNEKYTYGAFIDVTNRKRAEDALKESEEKFRMIFEKGQFGLSIADSNYQFIAANPSFCNMLGYTAEELLKLSFIDITPQFRLDTDKENIEAMKRGEMNQYKTEKQYLKKDGQLFWGSLISTPIRDKKSNVLFYINMIEDITDRKHAEEALKESENYARTLAYISKEIIAPDLSINKIANIIFDFALQLTKSKFGYVSSIDKQNGNNIGHIISEMLPNQFKLKNKKILFSKTKDGYKGLWGYSLNTGEAFYTNNPSEHPASKGLPEGHIALENFLSVPVIVNNQLLGQIALANKLNGFNNIDLQVIEDLAHIYGIAIFRTESEQELLISKEKAEESDRLKTNFLQNMSHEIRTPMNAIMGFSELLIKQINNKQKIEKYAHIINQRSGDLLELINEILDIAKIESGQLPVHIEECELSLLLNEINEFFIEYRKKLDKQHINFQINLPSSHSNSVIITDKVKLKQIFINLISNAFKFTHSGKIEAGCILDHDDHLVFYVSDTGIGIPKDKHDFIFDRFVQIDYSTSKKYSGAGLGLAIVKGLVSLLGGKIWLESELGKGSKFSFTFPYKTVDLIIKKSDDIEDSKHNSFHQDKILIVEDDIYNTEYLKEIFSDTNLDILFSVNGKTAVDIALNQPIDLVLLDIRLPDIEGYEVAKILKKQKPKLKIIAQTAYAISSDKFKAIEAGCDDYISKPINRKQLLSMISYYLSKRMKNK